MITAIIMTIEDWEDNYQPMTNHINPEASWNGALYETYGEELKFIQSLDHRHVWTYMDGDNGGTYLVSGRHFVNRIGYIVTAEPVPDDEIIQIEICEPDDELCESCESNEKETPEGKWCTSCKDDFKESDND
jgi:hypothetical protein